MEAIMGPYGRRPRPLSALSHSQLAANKLCTHAVLLQLNACSPLLTQKCSLCSQGTMHIKGPRSLGYEIQVGCLPANVQMGKMGGGRKFEVVICTRPPSRLKPGLRNTAQKRGFSSVNIIGAREGQRPSYPSSFSRSSDVDSSKSPLASRSLAHSSAFEGEQVGRPASASVGFYGASGCIGAASFSVFTSLQQLSVTQNRTNISSEGTCVGGNGQGSLRFPLVSQ